MPLNSRTCIEAPRPRSWQRESNDGSGRIRPVPGKDGPVVVVDDLEHDRETEAGSGSRSGLGRPVEALEDMIEVVVADTGASIGDRHPAFRDIHADRFVIWRPLVCVRDDIRDHPVDRRTLRYHNRAIITSTIESPAIR